MDCLCYADESEQLIYRLELAQRPWLTNDKRTGNGWERSKLTKAWRTAFRHAVLSFQLMHIGG